MSEKIHVDGREISIQVIQEEDYISLTDMVEKRGAANRTIARWLRNKNTLEFLGIWEEMYNPNFKPSEFGGVLAQAGTNRFDISVKEWCGTTGAIGIRSKQGRGGGTYAHRDIAFEFGQWISPKFKLLLIREFQRLKQDAYQQQKLEWNYSRYLSKVNYSIHTDAIRQNIIPRLQESDEGFAYATEADLINMAVFGMTARKWREANPDAKGNIRDHATIEELTVLSNLESHNADFIRVGAAKEARYLRLCEIAEFQFEALKRRDENRLLE